MNAQRYLLWYTGYDAPPAADVTYLAGRTRVVDRSRHCLLVEDTADRLRQLLKPIPRWFFEPEQMYQPLTRLTMP